MLFQNNRRCHGSNRLRLFRVVSLKSLLSGEFLIPSTFSIAVTEPSCKICVGAWPFTDHFLIDCGLTRAFVFEDQFFTGWTVLVLKDHASELFDLSRDARGMLMEEVTHVAQILKQVFDAKKINYELLGNQVPHIHWHLIPRLKTDPDPLKPVWCVPHEPVRLSAEQLAERVHLLRSALRIDPNQPR